MSAQPGTAELRVVEKRSIVIKAALQAHCGRAKNAN